MSAPVAATLIGGSGFARLEITVPRTASETERNPDSSDRRQKGLAVSRIVLRG